MRVFANHRRVDPVGTLDLQLQFKGLGKRIVLRAGHALLGRSETFCRIFQIADDRHPDPAGDFPLRADLPALLAVAVDADLGGAWRRDRTRGRRLRHAGSHASPQTFHYHCHEPEHSQPALPGELFHHGMSPTSAPH